eukprot:TRINITY_DN508_c0_g1_i1.p1 TRINITY_DN508_c0_g1~~TRINITY_DN508_c0_g1_i1.p1  ORF type:complete len:537 (-),score=185.18 TRINITY_DN508_c0_g1_i1:194-1804(-)
MQKALFICVLFLVLVQIINGLVTPSILAEYNGFVRNDFTSQHSDCWGRLACGGNVNIQNYAVGQSLDFSCDRYDLITGRVLSYSDGAVARGGIAYGEAAYVEESVYVNCDNIQQDYVVDFEDTFNNIISESEEFGGKKTTGTIENNNYGMLSLHGSGSGLDVFNIDMSGVHTVNVYSDEDSYVVINVHGGVLEISNVQINLEGNTNVQMTVWNFPDATSLGLENLSFKGAVVAPKADVHYENGHVDGSFVCRSYVGTGEFHYVPFIPPNGECTCEPCQTITFPETFSTFIRKNVIRMNTDDQGRLACGGDAHLENFGIGSRLTNSFGSRNDLIIKGNANLINGEVFFGNAVVNGNASTDGVSFPNGELLYDPIHMNFDTIFNLLILKSKLTSFFWSNGKTELKYGTNLELNGNDRWLNFFTLSSSSINKATSISINVPEGSFVIINVGGFKNTFTNLQMFLNGTPFDHILWNLYRTRTLTIDSVGIAGSILAPMADVNFTNGNLDGTLIAKSLQGDGEVHYEVFKPIVLPCKPCKC